MARGFGATLGAGTTDKIVSALTTHTAQRSYFVWLNKNGDGGGSAGRVFDHNSVTLAFMSPTTLGFNHTFTTTQGSWTVAPGVANGTWYSFGVKYDNGATTNDPTFYINGVKNTVGAGLTEGSTPVGTANSAAGSAITIGNRADDIRNYDGSLSNYAVWDALLSDEEFAALAKGFSPRLIRPTSLAEYVPMVRDNVSLKVGAPTITGTAVQPHPRVIGAY